MRGEKPEVPAVIEVRCMGVVDYQSVWQQMREYTDWRTEGDEDQLWLVEHPPVFTQGQAGKPEHILSAGEIPVVQSDRGGQVTYHGPGQMMAYPLLNLKRHKLGVRGLVTLIENSVVALLKTYRVDSVARADAPGVYVGDDKIASLGLRVRRGCSYHGVAINICADLRPFEQINPCGFEGLAMVNLETLVDSRCDISMTTAMHKFAEVFSEQLNVHLRYIEQ